MTMSPPAGENAPGPAGVSMSDAALIGHDIALEAFGDSIRRRVGRGPGKISVADLAAAIDVQARTVKAWRDGDTLPHWTAMLRLMAYFGPAFASEILAPAGLGGVERVLPAAVAPAATAADLVSAAHDLLERLRDGRFCHQDRAATAPALLALARDLEAQARAMADKGAR